MHNLAVQDPFPSASLAIWTHLLSNACCYPAALVQGQYSTLSTQTGQLASSNSYTANVERSDWKIVDIYDSSKDKQYIPDNIQLLSISEVNINIYEHKNCDID